MPEDFHGLGTFAVPTHQPQRKEVRKKHTNHSEVLQLTGASVANLDFYFHSDTWVHQLLFPSRCHSVTLHTDTQSDNHFKQTNKIVPFIAAIFWAAVDNFWWPVCQTLPVWNAMSNTRVLKVEDLLWLWPDILTSDFGVILLCKNFICCCPLFACKKGHRGLH